MKKKGEILSLKGFAYSQIFVLITAIVSFSFILGQASLVSAQATRSVDDAFLEGPAMDLPYGTPSYGRAGLLEEFDNRDFEFGYKPTEFNLEVSGTGSGTSSGATTGYALSEEKGFWILKSSDAFLGNLYQGFTWAFTAATVAQLVGGLAGFEQEQTNSLSLALSGGILAGKAAYGAVQKWGAGAASDTPGTLFGQSAGTVGTVVGFVVAAYILYQTFKKTSQKVVTLECKPWEPPLGGESCEECNDGNVPCTEYRCRSLGQACELLDAGTEEAKCAWVGRDDVNSPTIDIMRSALKPVGLVANPDSSLRPSARGVQIVDNDNSNGCLQPFTPLEFGIQTNEPAQCKIDVVRKDNFEQMQYYIGNSNYFAYNHTQKLRLPSPNVNETGPEFENSGRYSFFIRCMDANGNENVDEYSVSYCVDDSPDTTPPVMEGTSIVDGSAVQYDADKVPIQLYVNEPSECKWSRSDKSYEDMENQMSCENSRGVVINADLQFVCSSELTGIENRVENNFFFRCKDNPGKPEGERNTNTQSLPLTLRGSQPLNIIEVGPNETISSATDTAKVTLGVRTDDGSDEGYATCYFSSSGERDSYIEMFNTDNYQHTQDLDLTEGSYNYHFRCIDSGGNVAEDNTNFFVDIDREVPNVVRAYKEIDALKIITNEDSECVYSKSSCNYDFVDGFNFQYQFQSDKKIHVAEWFSGEDYYIKCRDFKNNEPSPNSCSIVVNAVDLE